MSNDSVSVLVSNSQVTRQPPLVAAANVRVEIPNDAESQMDNEEIPVLAQTCPNKPEQSVLSCTASGATPVKITLCKSANSGTPNRYVSPLQAICLRFGCSCVEIGPDCQLAIRTANFLNVFGLAGSSQKNHQVRQLISATGLNYDNQVLVMVSGQYIKVKAFIFCMIVHYDKLKINNKPTRKEILLLLLKDKQDYILELIDLLCNKTNGSSRGSTRTASSQTDAAALPLVIVDDCELISGNNETSSNEEMSHAEPPSVPRNKHKTALASSPSQSPDYFEITKGADPTSLPARLPPATLLEAKRITGNSQQLANHTSVFPHSAYENLFERKNTTSVKTKQPATVNELAASRRPITAGQPAIKKGTERKAGGLRQEPNDYELLRAVERSRMQKVRQNIWSECTACGERLETEPKPRTIARERVCPKHVVVTGDVKEWVCGIDNCTRSYTLFESLPRHIRKVHGAGPNIFGRTRSGMKYDVFCFVCRDRLKNPPPPRSSKWDRICVKHQVASEPGDKKKYRCAVDSCNQVFTGLLTLSSHIRVNHRGEQAITCMECGKHFPSRSGLQRHQRKHTKELPFKCEVCDKRFSQNSNLRSHMRQHTGEKPFVCEHCGRSFTHNVGLRRHKCRVLGRVMDPSSIQPNRSMISASSE